jgi:hypothetical protein
MIIFKMVDFLELCKYQRELEIIFKENKQKYKLQKNRNEKEKVKERKIELNKKKN